jgi:hypothetical protein
MLSGIFTRPAAIEDDDASLAATVGYADRLCRTIPASTMSMLGVSMSYGTEITQDRG